jgi:hypothetical protein
MMTDTVTDAHVVNTHAPGAHSAEAHASSTIAAGESSVSAVAVKVPPLYRNNPDAWFRTLESQFHLARITSGETKFHYLVAHLPEDLSAVLLSADTPADYESLKEDIKGIAEKSRQEKITEILAVSDLGGDKPSVFLRRLHAKMAQCGLSACPDMLKATLMRCLPSELRIALSGFQNQTPEQIAEIADSMLSIRATSNPINAVQQPQSQQAPRDSEQRRHQQQRPSNSVAPFRPGQRNVICRAHIYYGLQARTCRRWCQFPKQPGHQPRTLSNKESTPVQSRSSSPVHRQPSN